MAGNSSILFETISNVVHDKSEATFKRHTENPECWKTFSKFMLLRYLTMSASPDIRNIVLDNYLALERMPDKAMYRWLIKNIPKQTNGFIRYIK